MVLDEIFEELRYLRQLSEARRVEIVALQAELKACKPAKDLLAANPDFPKNDLTLYDRWENQRNLIKELHAERKGWESQCFELQAELEDTRKDRDSAEREVAELKGQLLAIKNRLKQFLRELDDA